MDAELELKLELAQTRSLYNAAKDEIIELRRISDALRAENRKLALAVSGLTIEKAELERMISLEMTQAIEIGELRTQLATAETKHREFFDTSVAIQEAQEEKIATLRADERRLIRDEMECRKEQTDLEEYYKEELAALTAERDALHDKTTLLVAENTELQEICDGMERGIVDVAGENVKLAQERDALRAQLTDTLYEVVALEKRADELDDEVESLRAQLAAAQNLEWQPLEPGVYQVGTGEIDVMEENTLGIMGADEAGFDAYATLAHGPEYALCRHVPTE